MRDDQVQVQPKPARILVIDDTELNRDMIKGILSTAGFDVETACDGQAGYEATWGSSYDLVLMDVEMPGMNGFEAAARIRTREGSMEGLTIAALTATQQHDAKDLSFWSGIDVFIERPIDPRALVLQVSQIISDRRTRTNDWKPVWRLGEFSAFTQNLTEQEKEAYIHRLMRIFSRISSSIDAGMSATEDFLVDINELLNLSSLLGFEETTAICRYYKETGYLKDNRCRDVNLLGVIERARYALARYQADTRPIQEHC